MSIIAIPDVRIYTKTGRQCHLKALIVVAHVAIASTCAWAEEAAIPIVSAAI